MRKYFEQFGKVDDVEWPFDKQTKARRNFAFIVFEEEEATERMFKTDLACISIVFRCRCTAEAYVQ